MTPTAPARAETASDERQLLPGAATHCRAERPLPGATAPLPGVPLIGPLAIRLKDTDDLPGGGRPLTIGCYVGLELDPANGRRLGGQAQYDTRVGGELQDAAAAGQELVRAAVAAAVATDGPVAALKSREARLKESLTNYTAEQRLALREHVEARQAVGRAIADGSDPAPFETREVAALDTIRQLETRITGTRSALDATAADITRSTAAVERSARARLRGQAEQELERLSGEIADALFDRLHSLTRLRAAALAARDG